MLTKRCWQVVQDAACPRACTAVLSDLMRLSNAHAWDGIVKLHSEDDHVVLRRGWPGWVLSRQFPNHSMAEGEELDLACAGLPFSGSSTAWSGDQSRSLTGSVMFNAEIRRRIAVAAQQESCPVAQSWQGRVRCLRQGSSGCAWQSNEIARPASSGPSHKCSV